MPSLILEPYGKAVVVKGDTREVKDFLKEKGGKWNKGLCGWIFPGSRGQQLLADLKGHGVSVQDQTGSGGGGGAGQAAAPAAKGAKRPAPEAGPAAPAAKQPKVNTGQPAAGEEVAIEIADKIRGTVSSFAGVIGVDIRRFYVDRVSDELRPTAKGIRLKADEWQALSKSMAEVEAAIAGDAPEAKLQITEEIVVTVKSQGSGSKSVDIRRFYVDRGDGELKPGKKGIYLNHLEWSGVKASAEEISAALRGEGGAPPAAPRAARRPAAEAGSAPPAATLASPDAAPRAAPAKAPAGSPEHLRERLTDLLRGRDLQAVSLKTVRGELEAGLGMAKGSLDGRKEEIKGIVTDLLQRGIP